MPSQNRSESTDAPSESRGRRAVNPRGRDRGSAGQITAYARLARARADRSHANKLEADALTARREANQNALEAATEARDVGYTALEIAGALGISRNRLYQLVKQGSLKDD